MGRLAASRRCVAALLRHTRRAWELIAVARRDDVATASYLAGVRDAASVPVTVLAVPRGRHPVLASYRAGLAVARGDYLALVRDSVVVTDAWLDQLAALLEMDPALGMAGPMTPGAPVPQRADVDGAAYDDTAGLAWFAEAWRRERRGRWQWADALSPACVLIGRRLLERPGGSGAGGDGGGPASAPPGGAGATPGFQVGRGARPLRPPRRPGRPGPGRRARRTR